MPQRVRVPASSANLGPGFDALGLALGVYLECTFERAATLELSVTGRDAAAIPSDERNLIWQTALAAAREAGHALPPARVDIHNGIPLGKGLGSSAAAIVAGVVLASELAGLQWSKQQVLAIAARMEGHPDNAAASVYGSVVASALDEDGTAHAVKLKMPNSVRVAVLVPEFVLPTHEARAVLPVCYTRADAIYNVQRAALLIAALAAGELAALSASLEDRMHQPYRMHLVPGLSGCLALRRPGLIGCTLSGAGPSILIFYETGADTVCELVRQQFCLENQGVELLPLAVDLDGYCVRDT